MDYQTIEDLDLARAILETPHAFRVARASEGVPGKSRSFFLADEILNDDDALGCREALREFIVSQRRGLELSYRQIAIRTLASLPEQFNLVSDYLRPYGRRVAYKMAGMPTEGARNIVATLRTAIRYETNDPGLCQTLMQYAWSGTQDLVRCLEPRTESLPGYAASRGLTVAQITALALPVLEMAAYDLNVSLSESAIHEFSASKDRRDSREIVLASAARLRDVVATRIVSSDVEIRGRAFRAGQVVLLPLGAATTKSASDPSLVFGTGTHRCLGRELAVGIAIAPLEALRERGEFGQTRTDDGGTLIHYSPPASSP